MKTVSNTLKNALKQPTTQRKGRILVNGKYYEVFNVKYYADVYNEGNVIGNAIASQLDFEMEYIEKFDTFKYFDGVWTGNDYEYVDMGTFTVFDEQDEDNFNKHITAFDNLIKFNMPFNDTGGYPKSLFNELKNLCTQAGVTLSNTSIPNGNFIVENNQFVNGESLKTILKQICSISGTYAIIKNDKLILQLKNTTNEKIIKNQHTPIEWKRKTYGINQVILGSSQVEGEYVIRQDENDIAKNGVHKLVINDNLFAYTEDKRDALIDALFQQVKGFGYMPYEMTGEWLNYLEIGDTVTIDDVETIILRIEGSSPKGLESKMSAPAVIDSSIEYLDNTNDVKNQLKRTELIVDKQNQEIQALVESVKDIEVDTTLTKQASGNPITIEDAGAYPCENFIVEGKSEQETTNGYQLVDFNNPTGIAGVGTYSFDGETLTYTSDGNTRYGNAHFNILDIFKNNPGKTLYFSFESYDFSNGYNACVQLNLINNGTNTYPQMLQTSGKVSAINIPEDTSGYTTALFCVYSNNGSTTTGTSYSVTIKKPMLSFTENASYEKYTGGVAGPNPDYPSEIETVKGIENLFDYENENNYRKFENVSISKIDNGIRIQQSVAGTYKFGGYVLNVDELLGKTFTLSCKYNANSSNKPKIVVYWWNGSTLPSENSISTLNGDGGTFTIPNEAKTNKLIILFYSNHNGTGVANDYVDYTYIQLNEGTTKKPFVPYGRYLYNKITGKNLANLLNLDTSTQGLNVTSDNDGKLSINGTATRTYGGIKIISYNTPILKKGDVVTFSWGTTEKLNRDTIGNPFVWFKNKDNTTVNSIGLKYNTATIKEDIYYMQIGIENYVVGTTYDEEMYVELEKSSIIPTKYEPYKENIITYDLKKENLFDKDSANFINLFPSSTGFISNKNYKSLYIEIEPNKTYTIHKKIYNNADISIGTSVNIPVENGSVTTVKSSSINTPISITSGANDKYLTVYYNWGSTNEQEVLDNIKIYEGTGTDDYYELVSIGDIKDELDETTGVLTKRIGKVVLEGNFVETSQASVFYYSINPNYKIFDNIPYSNRYQGIINVTGASNMYSKANNTIAFLSSSTPNSRLYIKDTRFTNASDFNDWLSNNPVTVYYVLAEPYTIQLEPTEIELFKGTNNIYTLDDLEPNMNITYLTDSKMNAQYATKSELKITEGRIESGINATLQEYSKTTEMRNIISQEVSESTNQILLEVENKIDEEVTGASILLKINEDTSSATINADKINLNGVVTANNTFKINTDGSMEATGGKIGGWSITTDDIYNSASGISSNLGKYAFWAGETNNANGTTNTDAKFRVGHDGSLHATAGLIGGWNISTDYIDYTFSNGDRVMLANGSNEYKDVLVCYVGGQVPFYLHSDGYLHASNANITGTITSSSGTIGGFTLGNYSLSGATTNGSMRIQRGSSASVDLPANGGRLMLGSTSSNGVALTTASTLVISDTYDHVTTGHDLATIGIRALNGHVRIASNDTVNINAPTFIVNGSAGWTGYLDVLDANGKTKLRLNFKSGICTGYSKL